MDQKLWQQFAALEPSSFGKVLASMGYKACACYRISGQDLLYVIGKHPLKTQKWPVHVTLRPFHYTASGVKSGLPVGYQTVSTCLSGRSWPKSTILYFPEQELAATKILFLLVPSARKTRSRGRLDGDLEVLGRRLGFWLGNNDLKQFITEASVQVDMQQQRRELRRLIDHELRTPLSIISGYVDLAMEKLGDEGAIKAMHEQLSRAVQVIDQLGVIIGGGREESPGEDVRIIPMNELIQTSMNAFIRSAEGVDLKVGRTTGMVRLQGVQRLLSIVMRELFAHSWQASQGSEMTLSWYTEDGSLVVDVGSDWHLLPRGHEEVLFWRFFEHRQASGHGIKDRGESMGLYFIRHLVERHGGQLQFIREDTKRGILRLMLPVSLDHAPEREAS